MGWWYFKLNYLHFILFLVECFETDFQTKGRFVEPGPRAGGERGAPAFQPSTQPKEEPAWQRAGCPPTRLPICMAGATGKSARATQQTCLHSLCP